MRVFNFLLSSLFILVSCRDDKNKAFSNENIPAINLNSVSHIATDTLKFKTLTDLLSYFSKEMDSLEKLKMIARTAKEPHDSSYINLVQKADSNYFTSLNKRNAAIYKHLSENKHSADNMEGIKYLVVNWEIPITQIDSLFHQFPSNLQNSTDGKFWAGKIEDRKRSETKSIYDISILKLPFITTDGRIVTLNDMSSKYLLLDFWASWCLPCRHENRILVKEKDVITRGTDLSIIAISLDENKEKWLKAAKEDGLNYMTICDYKALESPIVKGFGIKAVPYNVVISKDGKILATNLWGERLNDFLNELK
jgi:thiol-disulfide isomerase/thioredoxin